MLKSLIRSPINLSGAPPVPLRRALAAEASSTLGVFESTQIAVLRLQGADRARWLHGQCTQDIKGLRVGQSTPAFVLDSRGKNLADIVVGCFDDHLAVLCPKVAKDALITHWKHFIIAEDVVVLECEVSLYLITGLGLHGFLQDFAALTGDTMSQSFAFELKGGRGLELTFMVETGLMIPAAYVFGPTGVSDGWNDLASALSARNASLLPAEVFEMIRIKAGKPLFGVDIDGTTLPKESGDEPRRVSYTKGCYTGQEVVARQHFLGEPRRVLRGAAWRGGLVAVGSPVYRADGSRVGRVTSCAPSDEVGRCVGLVVIEGAAKLETDLVLSTKDIDDEPVALTIAPPHVMKP